MTFKFTVSEFDDWKNIAKTSNIISREVPLIEEVLLSEFTKIELTKLNVNSYLFMDYLNELETFLEEGEDGYLNLTEVEISNIWKCLLAVTTSKKELYKSSISLEIH